ncbi:uncharacterized protein [Haliotis asinina]|uniref:uncharacterized protein n=1 Tax=Haliotis asinina TaxID=109174 RepID=UPI0035326E6E
MEINITVFVVVVVPCIVGVILVTCAFTVKRRKLISGHNSLTDVSVSSPERKSVDKEGSEPFYVNVDNLTSDLEGPPPSAGVRSSRTNTKGKKETHAPSAKQPSRCTPEIWGIMSDTVNTNPSEDGGRGHESEHSICPSSMRCNAQHINIMPDTAIYSNCWVGQPLGSGRLNQPDHYTCLDTVHCPTEARPTLQAQSDMYVNTNELVQGRSTATVPPDHYMYLDVVPDSSVLSIQSDSDEYDLPYVFARKRNIPLPKHDHYINLPRTKKEKKKKKSNNKR